VCNDGWTGEFCTVRDFTGTGVDPECPPEPSCRNGGVCFNETCCCPPGTRLSLHFSSNYFSTCFQCSEKTLHAEPSIRFCFFFKLFFFFLLSNSL
jgi:hypothetical protein